jgi:hypothetical protein
MLRSAEGTRGGTHRECWCGGGWAEGLRPRRLGTWSPWIGCKQAEGVFTAGSAQRDDVTIQFERGPAAPHPRFEHACLASLGRTWPCPGPHASKLDAPLDPDASQARRNSPLRRHDLDEQHSHSQCRPRNRQHLSFLFSRWRVSHIQLHARAMP